jgi:hypothetical protein
VEGPETANLTFSASSTDASYNNLTIAPVPVAVTDNDQAVAASVTVTQSGGSTAVTEGGATDTVSVVLSKQPTANVSVTVNGGADVNVAGPGGTLAGSATLTFTPSNWNTAQTVTVAAVNDTAVEGPETANLTFSASSTDASYNNLTIAPVPVAVTDNDQGNIAFDVISLSGIPNKSYTSLQFGPDGRLYASDRFGDIFAFDIEQLNDPATGKVSGYKAVATEIITSVKSIANHNDDGQLNSAVAGRQVTGLVVAGTADKPVIYVGSSDPREGGGEGGGAGDTNLDTNSGIISRLTWNGTGWDKVDLVRGLPRSEENHSTNGLALTTDPVTGHKILLVAQGGHTNAGAPSKNFAYHTEYALSAAILSVDLTRLENPTEFPVIENGAHDYVYNLPTVKGTAQPFGGQDGLNQARLVAGSPVQVYSSGYRNAYDVVVTADGDIFTIDNGANQGWGGLPSGEGTSGVTNKLPTS